MKDAEAVRHDQDSATELGAAKPSCAGAAEEAPLRFAHSPNIPELLARIGGALWLTTYQAGKLIVLRPRGDRLGEAIAGPRGGGYIAPHLIQSSPETEE